MGIYLAHNLSFLERFGAASQIGRIDSRFFFVLNTGVQGHAGSLVTHRISGRAGADLGPTSPMARFRYTLPARFPAPSSCWRPKLPCWRFLLSQIHVDPGTGAFRRADSSRGRCGLDFGSSLDRGQHRPIFAHLDFDSVSAGDGALGVGEMESCRRRALTRGDVFWSGLRTSHQCRDANTCGGISSTSPI